jgi:hypothetical protein
VAAGGGVYNTNSSNSHLQVSAPIIAGEAALSGIHLTAALTLSTNYSSISVNALNTAVSAGETLTLTDGSHTQTLTVGTAGAASGATTVPVESFTANFSYVITTTTVTGGGLQTTPPTSGSGAYTGGAPNAWYGANDDSAAMTVFVICVQ